MKFLRFSCFHVEVCSIVQVTEVSDLDLVRAISRADILLLGCLGFSFLIDIFEGLSLLFFFYKKITQRAIVKEDAFIILNHDKLFEFLVSFDCHLTTHEHILCSHNFSLKTPHKISLLCQQIVFYFILTINVHLQVVHFGFETVDNFDKFSLLSQEHIFYIFNLVFVTCCEILNGYLHVLNLLQIVDCFVLQRDRLNRQVSVDPMHSLHLHLDLLQLGHELDFFDLLFFFGLGWLLKLFICGWLFNLDIPKHAPEHVWPRFVIRQGWEVVGKVGTALC